MKNDFRNAKVGDWVWSIRFGWVKITRIDQENLYSITIDRGVTFDLSGKFDESDVAPMLFIEPPSCFNAGPKPCDFEKGQKVLVRDHGDSKWFRRYFSHEDKDGYYTLVRGDEWTSHGEPVFWAECKPWEEGLE